MCKNFHVLIGLLLPMCDQLKLKNWDLPRLPMLSVKARRLIFYVKDWGRFLRENPKNDTFMLPRASLPFNDTWNECNVQDNSEKAIL